MPLTAHTTDFREWRSLSNGVSVPTGLPKPIRCRSRPTTITVVERPLDTVDKDLKVGGGVMTATHVWPSLGGTLVSILR